MAKYHCEPYNSIVGTGIFGPPVLKGTEDRLTPNQRQFESLVGKYQRNVSQMTPGQKQRYAKALNNLEREIAQAFTVCYIEAFRANQRQYLIDAGVPDDKEYKKYSNLIYMKLSKRTLESDRKQFWHNFYECVNSAMNFLLKTRPCSSYAIGVGVKPFKIVKIS